MKNLQTRFLKFIALILFVLQPFVSPAQAERIKQADSLFKTKQYIQSLELYQSAFDAKKYTPAMLLKMAYINEGLGKTGATLYFLKLYHLATNDEQALKKSEELAVKFNLAGYEAKDANYLKHWLVKNRLIIQLFLALILLGCAITIFIMKRNHSKPWIAFATMFVVALVLVYSNNYSYTTVIVASNKTYLMDGPSAGSPVASIIGEGNLLESLGEEDVWMKVRWMDKVLYVKENSVLKISL